MKISLKWLSTYVKVDEFFEAPEKLSEILTQAGLEVDAVTNQRQQFQNIVVGHVTELGKHPDADKLTVCQVDAGEGSLRQIICGAKNHKQGDKVVVTLPGAVLPGDFKIKDSKIRGVESKGMLASESELGLSDEAEGILILPEEAPIGASFAEYYGLDDVHFEISVTANRADCLSHLGLAREVACLLGRVYEVPVADFEAKGRTTSESVSLTVENKKACPRYAGRLIENIKVGPSPAWLKNRVEAAGMNSINNIVDVTNYVMLEMGQPLHAFDLSFLQGAKVIVRDSKAGEKFETLDGTQLELSGEELVICDAEKPVALAGVVGGKNSGVTEDTKDIFLEAAFFTNETVRHTARRFGIETESGQRFARGTDPDAVLLAMNRAAELIQKVAGGNIASDFLDDYPEPVVRQLIQVKTEMVAERMGYDVDDESFADWMTRLGCQVNSTSAGAFEILAPAFRWDLMSAIDLVEEYGRLHGYDKIPETMPSLHTEPSDDMKDYSLINRLSDLLVREGFFEAVNYSFLESSYQNKTLGDLAKFDKLGLKTNSEPVSVKNPLSEEYGVMRQSVLPSLLTNALHNYRHGHKAGRLFELGHGFQKSDDGFSENTRVGFVMWGGEQSLWGAKTPVPSVFELKAAIQRTASRLLIKSLDFRPLKVEDCPELLHPKQAAGLFLEGRMVGFVGTLHPLLKSEMKLRHDIAISEIDFESLMRGQPRVVKSASISVYPAVERDLSVLVPGSVTAAQVSKEIKKAGAPLVQSVRVFDLFEDDNMKDGERSLSFRMLCQKMDGTLSDEELQGVQSKVVEALEKKLQVRLR
jgi:phenylalanyl-tRNA synthetase beta chain